MEMWALGISVTVGIAFIGFVFWVGNWHGSVNSDRKAFKEFMQEIRLDIKKIFERLPPPTTATRSPISLTELGQEISDKLNVAAWAKTEAKQFYEDVAGKNPFEIQEISFNHALNFEPSEDLLKGMQQTAFDRGLDMVGVRDVFGVELRDVLLDHCEFHESELDNHEADADTGT